MVGETYDLIPHPSNEYAFYFVSEGAKGKILKVVLFQKMLGRNRFNLAFGDYSNGKVNDKVVSGNQDFVKVFSTVAKCAYEFVEVHPGARLRIKPVDERRGVVYNYLIKKHCLEIEKNFRIKGKMDGRLQRYVPWLFFDEFELSHRNA